MVNIPFSLKFQCVIAHHVEIINNPFCHSSYKKIISYHESKIVLQTKIREIETSLFLPSWYLHARRHYRPSPRRRTCLTGDCLVPASCICGSAWVPSCLAGMGAGMMPRGCDLVGGDGVVGSLPCAAAPAARAGAAVLRAVSRRTSERWATADWNLETKTNTRAPSRCRLEWEMEMKRRFSWTFSVAIRACVYWTTSGLHGLTNLQRSNGGIRIFFFLC